ncbi:hypothetical protein, partial [Brevibacterium paucivorans]
RAGYARDASGKPIECDYLMKVHQGSHSKDALSNNAHELFYAVRCSDGTEMAVTTLTPFGQPNEYIRNCTDEKVQTSGSDLHRLRSSWNRCSRAELMPLGGLHSAPSRRTEPRQGRITHAPEVPAGCR